MCVLLHHHLNPPEHTALVPGPLLEKEAEVIIVAGLPVKENLDPEMQAPLLSVGVAHFITGPAVGITF